MADQHRDHEHEHDEGYVGAATLTVGGRDVAVHAILNARHEPHDGRLHWFGRVAATGTGPHALPDPAALARAGRVELSTATGRAEARIGDRDPWGRYRVTGVGTPPYRMDTPRCTSEPQ